MFATIVPLCIFESFVIACLLTHGRTPSNSETKVLTAMGNYQASLNTVRENTGASSSNEPPPPQNQAPQGQSESSIQNVFDVSMFGRSNLFMKYT